MVCKVKVAKDQDEAHTKKTVGNIEFFSFFFLLYFNCIQFLLLSSCEQNMLLHICIYRVIQLHFIATSSHLDCTVRKIVLEEEDEVVYIMAIHNC